MNEPSAIHNRLKQCQTFQHTILYDKHVSDTDLLQDTTCKNATLPD